MRKYENSHGIHFEYSVGRGLFGMLHMTENSLPLSSEKRCHHDGITKVNCVVRHLLTGEMVKIRTGMVCTLLYIKKLHRRLRVDNDALPFDGVAAVVGMGAFAAVLSAQRLSRCRCYVRYRTIGELGLVRWHTVSRAGGWSLRYYVMASCYDLSNSGGGVRLMRVLAFEYDPYGLGDDVKVQSK